MSDKIEIADAPYEELLKVIELINKMYDFDFSGYSKESLTRRFNRFMDVHSLSSVNELKNKITNREVRLSELINSLTVNVTEMFRDPLFYKAIDERVIPYLRTFPSFKVWHAGCSTGEEVFSLAILLKEREALNRSIQYGTDINSEVIQQAKSGIYSSKNMDINSTNYKCSGGKGKLSDYYVSKYGSVKMDSEAPFTHWEVT